MSLRLAHRKQPRRGQTLSWSILSLALGWHVVVPVLLDPFELKAGVEHLHLALAQVEASAVRGKGILAQLLLELVRTPELFEGEANVPHPLHLSLFKLDMESGNLVGLGLHLLLCFQVGQSLAKCLLFLIESNLKRVPGIGGILNFLLRISALAREAIK